MPPGIMMVLFVALLTTATSVKHTHLFDVVGAQNFLFRGGSPEVDGVFSIEALKASLGEAAKAANQTLPANYNLVVINVENLDTSIESKPDDGDNVLTEHAFFAQNPSVGQFLFWKMTGEAAHAANKVFDGNRQWLANSYEEWGGDKLVGRIERLRTMMLTLTNRSQVIFFHW